MNHSRFQAADYVVFTGTVTVSLGIGIYFAVSGRRQSSNKEYLTGGGEMMLLPVAISLLVTLLSTIGLLGNPAEVFAYGTQYMMYLLAMIPGITCGTYLFVPLYYPLGLTSVFEYYNLRFGERYVELFGAVISLIKLVLLNGLLTFAPCVAFESVSGFPAWGSVIICGLSASIYTSLGGMKAVVWADVFQACVIFAGLLAIVIKGTYDVGGIKEVWRLNEQWNRVEFFDFRPDPTIRLTFWSVVVADSLLWACMLSAQASVQRFNSLSSLKRAKRAALLMIPGYLTSGLLTCLCGVTAFAYYAKKGCDPLAAGYLTSSTQILPYFVMDIMNIPCLPGLFIACIFSASLSSISSNYNAMAAVTWGDILQHKYSHLSIRSQTTITKVTTFAYGILSTLAAFLLMGMGGTLVQISYSVMSALRGPLVGVVLLGGLFTRPGARSTLAAMLVAIVFSSWLSFGSLIFGTNAPTLPGPTYGCSIHRNGTTPNETESMTSIGPQFNPLNTPVTAHPFLAGSTDMAPDNDVESSKSGLQWFYSISYFYYSPLAVITVFITANFLSFIPGFEKRRPVEKRLLFTFLRRHFGVKSTELARSDTYIPVDADMKTEAMLDTKL